MYEVIVETFCISRCIYATCNAVRILFDGCYEDKMDAVEAYIREKYCAWVDAHRDEIERESGLKLRLERLQSLEHLQKLQRLQSLENPSSSLHIFQGDYRDVVIPKSSGVVYCDPPYRNTASYYDIECGEKRDLTKTFDYDSFYAWCEYQSYVNKNPVFVSSYDLPSDKFRRVALVDKGSSLHGGMNHHDDKIEGLYVPKEQDCDLVDYVQVKLF